MTANAIHADVAIIGGGFAGSILAMCLQQSGLRTVVIERGQHPRFAIGESSTPTAGFSLQRLAQKYDLTEISPLVHYGSWRENCSNITCGCKRGFSYFHHVAGHAFSPSAFHQTELLVAANASTESADTHWYRAETDQFLFECAERRGVHMLDNAYIENIEHANGWLFSIQRNESVLAVRSPFVVDATGGANPLGRIRHCQIRKEELNTTSRALFAHFEHVGNWRTILSTLGGTPNDHPFDCDKAALHHLFQDGWMWVLRFDNNITSAGFALDMNHFPINDAEHPEAEWNRLLAQFPSINDAFRSAKNITPITRTARLQHRFEPVAGIDWAMIPSAAGFVDPLYSSGMAHTMLGIERLAQIIPETDQPRRERQLKQYAASTTRELQYLDKIVHAGYLTSGKMDDFAATSMLYFLGATASEHRYRTHSESTPAFLCLDDLKFREKVDFVYQQVKNGAPPNVNDLGTLFEEYNVAGLCDPGKHNMYEYV